MLVEKVFISEDRGEIDIIGKIKKEDHKKLERIAKKFVYRFGIIGWENGEEGNKRFQYLYLNECQIRYGERGNFSLSYGESFDALKFLKHFQKKFGKIDDSKITYDLHPFSPI